MKVGIVTIFDNNNQGNRLQNYALQQVLLRYADQVVTMKNKPWYSKKSRIARMLPLAESAFFNRLLGLERRARIVEFTARHVKLSRGCYWYDKAGQSPKKVDRCDWYCAGSDQVWNPTMGRGGSFDYLAFAPRERTFSYAASFGIEEIEEDRRQAVAEGLKHIRHLSVREDAGKQIVESLTGRTDVQVLVDPTMLLTREEWDTVIAKPAGTVPQRYVLTYFLGTVSDERRAVVADRARELGCEVINLMDSASPFHAMAPHEFVWLIKNAQYICTDSFHAGVFSFLYGRPFAILARAGKGPDMGSRMKTFMGKFSLEGCAAVGDVLPGYEAQPDYSLGYAALEAERAKSKAFLENVFKG